jgi:hypothetical protein
MKYMKRMGRRVEYSPFGRISLPPFMYFMISCFPVKNASKITALLVVKKAAFPLQ